MATGSNDNCFVSTSNTSPATVTEICRRCGVERHQVTYLIRARGIKPARRVGAVRVFSAEQADQIANELVRRRIDGNGGQM